MRERGRFHVTERAAYEKDDRDSYEDDAETQDCPCERWQGNGLALRGFPGAINVKGVARENDKQSPRRPRAAQEPKPDPSRDEKIAVGRSIDEQLTTLRRSSYAPCGRARS